MKQLLKIVLILFDSPPSQCTDKNLFSRVVVNCELKIETGNKKYKTKCPTDSQFSTELSKTKYHVFFFPKEGKELTLKTLEVYNVKTLEVYNVKKTRGV